MGAVAEHAGLLDRRMDRLLGFYAFFLVRMTGITERIPVRDEPVGKIALVVVVTAGAVARSDRRMHDGVLGHAVGMALKAECGHPVLQHGLVRRLVRIMTGGAVASLDRSVHYFLLIFRLMAHGAKLRTLLHKRDGEITGMLRGLALLLDSLMTGRAHAFLHRIMHDFVLAQGSMALGCYASLCLRPSLLSSERGEKKENREGQNCM